MNMYPSWLQIHIQRGSKGLLENVLEDNLTHRNKKARTRSCHACNGLTPQVIHTSFQLITGKICNDESGPIPFNSLHADHVIMSQNQSFCRYRITYISVEVIRNKHQVIPRVPDYSLCSYSLSNLNRCPKYVFRSTNL